MFLPLSVPLRVRLTRHGDRRRPGVREVRRARGGDGPRGGSFGGRGAPNGTFFSLLGRALALTSCRGRRAVGPEGFLARGSLEAVDVLAHAGSVVRGGQHGGCAEGVRVGRKRERNVGRDDANEPTVFDAVCSTQSGFTRLCTGCRYRRRAADAYLRARRHDRPVGPLYRLRGPWRPFQHDERHELLLFSVLDDVGSLVLGGRARLQDAGLQ